MPGKLAGGGARAVGNPGVRATSQSARRALGSMSAAPSAVAGRSCLRRRVAVAAAQLDERSCILGLRTRTDREAILAVAPDHWTDGCAGLEERAGRPT
jgi:hypothetical protein